MSVNNGKRSLSSSLRVTVPASLTGSMESEAFDVGDTKVQHYGLLMKKPFGHKSGRWQKRFFIVKEGFLLYYPESESKAFDRAHIFNIHPKGVIPLGGCDVNAEVSGPQKFAIKITHEHFKGEIWLGAENQEDCSEWVEVLRDAGKVTWRNAQFGEKVIIQMEEKSRQTASELKEAIDDLTEKASVLQEEKEKKSELEALAARLEKEKKAIEDAAKNLRQEKATVQQELQQTLKSVSTIEEEKASLCKVTEELQTILQTVSKEKEQTTAELQERERLARELEEEKQHLEETTSHLKAGLISMEEKQKLLEEEKKTTVEQLRSQKETAKQLESEKRKISDTAQNLQANLKQVSQEKETTEYKWKEERQRRIKTEKRLRLAEDSLKRLDKALKESGVQIDIQIETDVKHLKRFFEDCIAEEQFEAQKLDIMRDAVRAKATYDTSTKHIETAPIRESPEPPSIILQPPPVASRPPPIISSQGEVDPTSGEVNTGVDTAVTTTSNGATGNEVSQGSEVNVRESAKSAGGDSGIVENGSTAEGSEVVANGDSTESEGNAETTPNEPVGGSEVVANGDIGGVECNPSCQQVTETNGTVSNGIPSTA